jgi:hypothetical protein
VLSTRSEVRVLPGEIKQSRTGSRSLRGTPERARFISVSFRSNAIFTEPAGSFGLSPVPRAFQLPPHTYFSNQDVFYKIVDRQGEKKGIPDNDQCGWEREGLIPRIPKVARIAAMTASRARTPSSVQLGLEFQKCRLSRTTKRENIAK